MAICSSCGAQLEEGSRFCVKCGTDQTAKTTGAPAPAAAVPASTPPPMPFVAPGQVPMSVAIPPPAPAKKSGMVWLAVIAVAAGAYYYYTHNMKPQTQPGQTPPPQTQPGNPGQQPGPNPGQQPVGYPGQLPGANPVQQPGYPGQQPGANPGQQPGGGGQPSPAAELVSLQRFSATYQAASGMVEVVNARWMNGSNVPIQSATLTCVQYAVNGQPITAAQKTLNGPVPAGGTATFQPFTVGAVTQYTNRVNCQIVAVTPAS
jgi:hypothetical protein